MRFLSCSTPLIVASWLTLFSSEVTSTNTQLNIHQTKTLLGSLAGDQPKEVLDVYKGNAAEWDDYFEIVPKPGKTFRVDFYYKLPENLVGKPLEQITVSVNSMGSAWAQQRRYLKIRNQASNKWETIGNNKYALSWEWFKQVFTFDGSTLANYVDSQNKIRLRYQSNNDQDVVDLDYLAVHAVHVDEIDPDEPFGVKKAADLPAPNDEVAAGNPLKGMITSPLWVDYNNQDKGIPTSMDYYYVPFDTTMTGDNTFDWTYVESLLQGSASQNRHAILRFMLDYPAEGNYVPQFLLDAGLDQNTYTEHGGGKSPNYTSPTLMNALDQFIAAFGSEYDGDSRLAFVQAGLLGFWGEWHTYPHEDWIPDEAMVKVATWFDNAFSTTPLQMRYAHASAPSANFGFHDDSFAHSTLSDSIGWYFWPQVEALEYTDFWKTAVMGGELRPELQSRAFSSDFPNTNAEFAEQDFDLCVDTTHATYMLNYYAFAKGYTSSDLTRAKASASRMGYQFQVSQVAAFANIAGSVDLKVDIMQTGLAPFYYDLDLHVACGANVWVANGVEGIIEKGETKTFEVTGLPKTSACLSSIVLSLDSPHAYPANPVQFAQGSNGNVEVSFDVPT